MRVYTEIQRFNQWWLLVIFTIIISVVTTGIYQETNGFKKADNLFFLFFIIIAGMFPFILLWKITLQTRIDQNGIQVKFQPFGFTEKKFAWKEIKECYIRKYAPIPEFGGWGIRGIGRTRAYNVSGNIGIQIVTHTDKKFLVGTRQPEIVKAVLNNYKSEFNVL